MYAAKWPGRRVFCGTKIATARARGAGGGQAREWKVNGSVWMHSCGLTCGRLAGGSREEAVDIHTAQLVVGCQACRPYLRQEGANPRHVDLGIGKRTRNPPCNP